MNYFSTKRLFLLIKKTWIENYRVWAMALGVLIAMYFIFHFLTTDRTHIIDFFNRQRIYSVGLIVSGTIFANFIWRDFSSKGQSINFLLLPATPFEKLLTAIFYTSIVFPLVYISIFFVLDFIYIQTISSVTTVKIAEWDLRLLSLKDTDSIVVSNTVLFLIIQPIALMSSLVFEKFSYVKTALLLVVLFLSFGYLASFIKNIALREVVGGREIGGNMFNLTEVEINSPATFFLDTVSIPNPTSYVITITLTLGSALFFTFTTFLKLKEKEI